MGSVETVSCAIPQANTFWALLLAKAGCSLRCVKSWKLCCGKSVAKLLLLPRA